MSAKITFQTSGIMAKLKALGDVDGKLERAAKKGLVVSVGHVQNLAPVDTSNLKNSYQNCSAAEQLGPGKWQIRVTSDVKYQPDQEYGTRYQPGKPHLRPGMALAFPEVRQIVKEEFK